MRYSFFYAYIQQIFLYNQPIDISGRNNMNNEIIIEILIKLILAFILGGLLGLERQQHGRIAGFRTHILVCFASTILMLSSSLLARIPSSSTIIQIDPARMAVGIMTGMGFIGAGTIVRSKNHVRGVTTAANVWLTAALGVSIGLGYYSLAILGTIFSFIVLWVLGKLDYILKTEHFEILTVSAKSSSPVLDSILVMCEQANAHVIDINYIKKKSTDTAEYKIFLRMSGRITEEQMIDEILSFPDVNKVTWKSF
jgi:putative Mg2+ transporter-C (MgtC) family protein